MAILINKNAKLICQGINGNNGAPIVAKFKSDNRYSVIPAKAGTHGWRNSNSGYRGNSLTRGSRLSPG